MTEADTKDRMCHECRVYLSSQPCLMKVSSWSFISNIVTNQHCRSLFCSVYGIENNVSGLSIIAKRLIAYCKQSASIKLMFSPIDLPLWLLSVHTCLPQTMSVFWKHSVSWSSVWSVLWKDAYEGTFRLQQDSFHSSNDPSLTTKDVQLSQDGRSSHVQKTEDVTWKRRIRLRACVRMYTHTHKHTYNPQ